jgi:uncharacterized protein (TIGR02145 family)
MKTNSILLAAGVSLALAFTLSCSDGDKGDNFQSDTPSSSSGGELVKKAKITGAFQKGAFVEGTTATLNELDNDLNPTGRPYHTLITDSKGTFELRNVELVSPYAHLIANGFFLNEVTGKKSDAPITLQAIVDVTDRDNVNVNVLTHLEYYRVIDLVDGGMTIKAAKKQAQKEIFAVFGIDSEGLNDSEDMTIFGMSESDAALLAVSILLLGDLSEADLTQRLMNFSQAIKNGGTWDNEEAKGAIAAWIADANFTNIRNNILSWNLSSDVPAFEKYANEYWTKITGLGECNGKIYDLATKNCIDNKISCKGESYNSQFKGCFIDERDEQVYGYVLINNQVWLSENLNYETDGSKCHGEDNELFVRDSQGSSGSLVTLSPAEVQANCNMYGRLYNWNTLMNGSASSSANPSGVRGICPKGWHIPSDAEWEALEKYADPDLTKYQANENIAGTKLKAKKGWISSGNGTDDYGFSALPADNFNFKSELGYWWSASEASDSTAYYRDMNYRYSNIYKTYGSKTRLMSARCVQD